MTRLQETTTAKGTELATALGEEHRIMFRPGPGGGPRGALVWALPGGPKGTAHVMETIQTCRVRRRTGAPLAWGGSPAGLVCALGWPRVLDHRSGERSTFAPPLLLSTGLFTIIWSSILAGGQDGYKPAAL